MTTLYRNLVIQQGATFSNTMPLLYANGDSVDVTGASGTGKIRPHHESNTSANLTVTLANGEVTVSLTANASANLSWGLWVYDVEVVYNDGSVVRTHEGKARVTPESTR